jgi:hypothetical protein
VPIVQLVYTVYNVDNGQVRNEMTAIDDDIQSLNDPVIDLLLLADRAEAINGKLYIMGGAWDQLTVLDLQQAVLFSFALGILVPWNATNQQYTVHISIEDEDKQPIGVRADAGFTVGRPPLAAPGTTQRVLLAVPVVPVVLPKYGSYTVTAAIPGLQAKRVPFRVVGSTQPNLPQQPPPQS